MDAKFTKAGLMAFASVALIACAAETATETNAENAETKTVEVDEGANLAAAVANEARPEEDRADDASRKPAEVLAFAGVKPGMAVFEVESGSGYYTEILSRAVGADGSVVMQNPRSFDTFLGDALEQRLADNRLANVKNSRTQFDNLDAEDGSIDVVTWFLGPHELYYTPQGSDGLGDVETTYAEIFRILKPGGAFVALDHKAAAGAPETTGEALHRIDPAIVKDLAAAAGFELVDESDVLSNPDDDYEVIVFDPQVRRKTDRFLLKFKKPA